MGAGFGQAVGCGPWPVPIHGLAFPLNSSGGSSVPQLTPGSPRQMHGEAIARVKALPRDSAQRADAFEALARQIELHSGGTWQAARGSGPDGSEIFLGRQ